MARSFNGTSDNITVAPGTLAQAYRTAGLTVVAIVKRTDGGVGAFRQILSARNAGNTGGFVLELNDAGTDGSTDLSCTGVVDINAANDYITDAMGWVLLAWDRDAGAGSQNIRVHRYLYNTGVWDHTFITTVNFTDPGTLTRARIGCDDGATTFLQGDLAAVGVWATTLSTPQLEGMTATYQSWLNLSPVAAWQFNQTSVATPVRDSTGHGADQTAISGTSVAVTDPSGFAYVPTGAQQLDVHHVPGAGFW